MLAPAGIWPSQLLLLSANGVTHSHGGFLPALQVSVCVCVEGGSRCKAEADVAHAYIHGLMSHCVLLYSQCSMANLAVKRFRSVHCIVL